jgi:hypothetical protein
MKKGIDIAQKVEDQKKKHQQLFSSLVHVSWVPPFQTPPPQIPK